MFGYIVPLKQELRMRELAQYNAYYCGLCASIGARFGQTARLTLNYDSTFLFTPQVGCCYRLTDESALGWNSIVRRTTIHWISTWFLALRCIADWSRPREKRYSQRASIPFPAGENLLRNTVFPNQNKMLW